MNISLPTKTTIYMWGCEDDKRITRELPNETSEWQALFVKHAIEIAQLKDLY